MTRRRAVEEDAGVDKLSLVVDGYRGASSAALCACLYGEHDSWIASDAASTALGARVSLGMRGVPKSESMLARGWRGEIPEWVRAGDIVTRLSAAGDEIRQAAGILSKTFQHLDISSDDQVHGWSAAWLVACAAWFALRADTAVYCVRLVGSPEWNRWVDSEDGPMFKPGGLFAGVPIVLRPNVPVKRDLVALLKSVASFDPPALTYSDIRLGEDALGLQMATYIGTSVGELSPDASCRLMAGGINQPSHYVVQTNIDDMNPEWMTHLIPRLLDVGADDAYLTPVHMKKGRVGFLLTVLCAKEQLPEVERVIFRETTSIGLRYHEVQKRALTREFVNVKTPYGLVRVKVAYDNGVIVNRAPEYEEARRAAEENGVSVKEVYEAVYRTLDGSTP